MSHLAALQLLLKGPLSQMLTQQAGPAAAHATARLCSSWQLQSTRGMCQRRGYSSDEGSSVVQRNLLVDTLQLAHKFEEAGLDRRAAEQLACNITELIVMNKVKMEDAFVSNRVLDKFMMEQESRVMSFKTELSKAQDMVQANVNKDLERQQGFLDKMRAEVRHEIDKLSASQRLDMNLEKGRMRDDLQLIRDKTTELEIRVDREINELKSSVERSKNDTIKSVITILGTFSAIAFTISRFVQMGS